MALIKCPDCGRDISDTAVSCPNCGHPINIINQASQKPVVIEKTSKQWKIVKLVSVIVFIIGIMVFFGNYDDKKGMSDIGTAAGASLALMGLLGILIGKIGAWWTNR